MSSPPKKMINIPGPAALGDRPIAPLQHRRIARLAYSYWEARGRPHDSPEQDWFRAEEELRRKKSAWTARKDRRRRAPVARATRQGRASA